MKTFFQDLLLLKNKWDLILVMTSTQLKSKHIGSVLGIFWTFYSALFPVLSYVLVFFFIAKVRVPGADSAFDYLIYVLSGTIPWFFISGILLEAIESITANIGLLKQSMFPLEILSIITTAEKVFNLGLHLALFLLILAFAGKVSFSLLLIPVYFSVVTLFCLGAGWLLSIVGFFIRDFKEILSSILHFLIYFTPILYDQANVSPKMWAVMYWNPVTHFVLVFRDIVIHSSFNHPDSLAIVLILSFSTFVLGYSVIRTVKRTVADEV